MRLLPGISLSSLDSTYRRKPDIQPRMPHPLNDRGLGPRPELSQAIKPRKKARYQPHDSRHNTRLFLHLSGEGGIRTHVAAFATNGISSAAPSASRSPLRNDLTSCSYTAYVALQDADFWLRFLAKSREPNRHP